jgi:hypothetical protein
MDTPQIVESQYRKISQSVWVLIAVNLYPLFGIFFLHWSAPILLLLYWAESLAIGFFNILKMIKIGIYTNQIAVALGSAAFFVFHFGIFMLGHLAFILFFIYFKGMLGVSDPTFSGFIHKVSAAANIHIDYLGLLIPVILLFISHGISYVQNFIGKQEYLHKSLPQVMMEPYGRVTLMHIVILFGGFLSILVGSTILMATELVLIKIIIDVITHLTQHKESDTIEEREKKIVLKNRFIFGGIFIIFCLVCSAVFFAFSKGSTEVPKINNLKVNYNTDLSFASKWRVFDFDINRKTDPRVDISSERYNEIWLDNISAQTGEADSIITFYIPQDAIFLVDDKLVDRNSIKNIVDRRGYRKANVEYSIFPLNNGYANSHVNVAKKIKFMSF